MHSARASRFVNVLKRASNKSFALLPEALKGKRGARSWMPHSASSMTSNLARLQSENAELSTVCVSLRSDKKKQQHKLTRLAEQLSYQQQVVEEKAESIQLLQEDKSQLQQHIRQLKQDKERLQTDSNLLKSELDYVKQQLHQSLTFHAEEDKKQNCQCILSVAFDDTRGRTDIATKYAAAVQSFIQPLKAKYIIKTELIKQPQHCQFLLWVTFSGGDRLEKDMSRYMEFAELAGDHICNFVQNCKPCSSLAPKVSSSLISSSSAHR